MRRLCGLLTVLAACSTNQSSLGYFAEEGSSVASMVPNIEAVEDLRFPRVTEFVHTRADTIWLNASTPEGLLGYIDVRVYNYEDLNPFVKNAVFRNRVDNVTLRLEDLRAAPPKPVVTLRYAIVSHGDKNLACADPIEVFYERHGLDFEAPVRGGNVVRVFRVEYNPAAEAEFEQSHPFRCNL